MKEANIIRVGKSGTLPTGRCECLNCSKEINFKGFFCSLQCANIYFITKKVSEISNLEVSDNE